MWDFHAHLDFYAQDELDRSLAELEKDDLRVLASSVDPDSWRRNLAIERRSSRVVATFGIHPEKAADWVGRLGECEAYFTASPLIGEIGLDALWVPPETWNAQVAVFRWFIRRCAETGKWSVIHTKDAENEVLDTLREFHYGRAVIHWYSGPLDLVDEFLDLGCLFSFGVETARSAAVADILARVPPERILLETDNPVGEEWLGGGRGFPSLIREVAATVARAKGLAADVLAEMVDANGQLILAESGIEA